MGIDLKKGIGFIFAPLLFLYIILFVDLDGEPVLSYTLAIAVLMAIWWVTEVIPLAITALIPIVLFPVFGIMNGKDVSMAYVNHIIFLFIGGFIVALAMEKWNLHKRIALKILSITGNSASRILLGFMFSSAFLSMWISNTATAMMMLPIVISIIIKLEEQVGADSIKKYAIGLLLAVAYGSSIGGISTLIGTPPNLSFSRVLIIMFPEAPEISFSGWFIFVAPLSIVFFLITWFILVKRFAPKDALELRDKDEFKEEYKGLGKATFEERAVFFVFISLALLWLTRNNIVLGSFVIPGWSNLFGNPKYINDGTVAIALSILLYLIPSKNQKGKMIMDWEATSKLPWNIVLLFGGGFALATGFKESGLSIWFGEQLSSASSLHPFFLIMIISFAMTFLTELTSNTATVEMILPILAGLSVSIGIHPLLIMLPATISASMAFMLPVATPPNAIIFGSNRVPMMEMAKTGLILNLIGMVLTSLCVYFWGSYIFGFEGFGLPAWAY